MASPQDAILHEDETRSNTTGRGEYAEGHHTPLKGTISGHHVSSSEKDTNSPQLDRSTAGHRTPYKSDDWAEIDHAPTGQDHGLGHPVPDDRDGAEIDPARKHGYPHFKGDLPWSQRKWWYQLLPGRGMYFDLRRRLPFLVSDWTTAFEPRNWYTVAQYVIRMYFINLMPALSYIIDMNHRTDGAYGVNEVILASALAAIVFPLFAIQPLTFVGVTGLINLVNYTQYNLVVGYYGLDRLDYLRVQAWSLIWAAFFHFVVAIFNISDYTRFITDMTSETFGFYVGIVYIQKGIELLILEYEPAPLDNATGWFSVTIAILFTVSVYLVTKIGQTSFMPFRIRYFISSFAFAAGCIFWTGFSHFPRNSLERIPIERLPITKSFFPSIDRPWFIDFWNIELRWVFVGAPLGFLIMILFYFDHNVSSVMAQARQFPVKKPAGFHWDFFLLGITTLVSGFLGLPAPNGLVPQCPWSTDSLSVYKQVDKGTHGTDEEAPLIGHKGKKMKRQHIVNVRVVESRIAPLLVGGLTLATMTRPFLVALGTMPRALFAGIFILVGWSSIEGNGITQRTLALFQDRRLSSYDNGLLQVKRSKIALYVGIQWLFFALTIAISQTIAAIGFPVIIVLLIPVRYYIVPKWFSPRELRVLDAPTANADVVLASLGHETEAVTGQGMRIARDTKIAGSEWPDSDYEDDDHDEDGGLKTANNGEKGAHQSDDVTGYSIGDDDDEDGMADHDRHGRATPYADIDPEGHYRNWMDQSGNQSPRGTSAALGAAGAVGAGAGIGAMSSDRESGAQQQRGLTSQAKPKENKRTKSVTQSWWGNGASEPVQRAQTPTSTQQGSHLARGPTSTADAATGSTAATATGGGLGAWLARKKQGSSKPLSSDETVENRGMSASPVEMQSSAPEAESYAGEGHVPAQSTHTSALPSNLPGANVESAPHDDMSTTHGQAGLFSMAQSPSQAGTIAAEAVRSLQSDSHRGGLGSTASNEVAMPSNVPSSLPVPRFGQDQHQITLDPNDPHHIRVQSPHPNTSIDINRGSVQLLRDDTTAGQSEAAAPLTEAPVASDNGGMQRANSKDEEKLQSLVRRQTKERKASEAKREKLQSQLRAIEEKAALAKATGAAGAGTAAAGATSAASSSEPAVPQLPRSLLTALPGQVAGHEDGVYTLAQNSYVVKPCTPIESQFYEVAVIDMPKSMSRTQRNLIKRLRTFLPTFHGQVDIVGGSVVQPASSRAVILENLSRDYNFANVLDVKLGKQLYDEDASSAKRARMDDVASKTTSGSSGIRLTGWRTWDPTHATFTHVDKTFGKSIQGAQLETGLRCFFGLGSDADAQVVSDHSRQRYSPPRLPAKNLEAIIDEGVLPAVDEIIDIVKKMHWRMRSGSLLIAFEGDPAIVSLVTKKSDLWAGRRSHTEKDSQVDLAHLDAIPVVAPALRLVDVRLIDFAHTTFVDEGRDDGVLAGLESLRNLLARIAKDARKGKIGQKDFGVANDATSLSSGIGEPVLVGAGQSRASVDQRARPAAALAPAGAATATTAAPAAVQSKYADKDENSPASKADAQSVKSDKRKSRGFLGIFGGKQDKTYAKQPAVAESAPKADKSSLAPVSQASQPSQTLPPFAFESARGDSAQASASPADGEGASTNPKGVAAPAALGALGAGGVILAAEKSKPPSTSTDPVQTAQPAAASSPPQEPIQQSQVPLLAATALPAAQDKGKGKAPDSDGASNPVDDNVNLEREHPHGKGLNSLLHDKGVLGQTKETSAPTIEPAAVDDSSSHHRGELAGGAALLGAGALAAGEHGKTHAEPSTDKSAEADTTAKPEKRHGLLGFLRKDSGKKDAQAEPAQGSSTTQPEVQHPASGIEALRGQSQADAEKQLHDESEARERYHAQAIAPKSEAKGAETGVATAVVPATAMEAARGESSADAERKLKDEADARQAYHEKAVAETEGSKKGGILGLLRKKSKDDVKQDTQSEAPASAMEAARGESSADAERKLKDEADARQAYHEKAVAQNEESKKGGILGLLRKKSKDDVKETAKDDRESESKAPAAALVAAPIAASAAAKPKVDDDSAAQEADNDKTAATDEKEKKGGILGLFKKGPKDDVETDTAQEAAPASAMEAARGESSADAERKLHDEADARQAYHENALAQEGETKKGGILGLFRKSSKDDVKTESQQKEEAPASAMEAARGESSAEAERKLRDEAEARDVYHEKAVAAAEDKRSGGISSLFKPGAPAPFESGDNAARREEEAVAPTASESATANGTTPTDEGSNATTGAVPAAVAAGAGTALLVHDAHDPKEEETATKSKKEADPQSSTSRKSSDTRRHGILGLFKKESKDDVHESQTDASRSTHVDGRAPTHTASSTARDDELNKDRALEEGAALGLGGGLLGAAVARNTDPTATAEEDAAQLEREALQKSQAEQASRQQAAQKQVLTEAAAVKREESENAKAREEKARKEEIQREEKAREDARLREKKAREDAKLREKKAQEDAKLREKKEKEEAKLQKKRAKEQAKADKEQEKADRKKAKEEEKQRHDKWKADEKAAAVAAAALAAQQKEAADAKKRKEKLAEQQSTQHKEAAAAAAALEASKKEAADLEYQRRKEAMELETAKVEAAEVEKQRAYEKDLLEKQRKEAAEIHQQREQDEAALKKHKEELAALEEKIKQEQAAIEKQRELAAQLEKQKLEEQAALEAKHGEAIAMRDQRAETQVVVDKTRDEVAEADKALEAEKTKVAEQQRSVDELEKKRKDEEVALAKQKEEAARLEKEQQAEAKALEQHRKEADELEKKRLEDEAALERQRQEAAEVEKKRVEEEALAKEQQAAAAEVHEKLQEEEAALEKAREEMAATESARKKEQAELNSDKKEAAQIHKKTKKEEAALKLSQKQTAKIQSKIEKEQAALERAQSDAAAAEEARQKEAAALAEKKQEREQARARGGSSTPSDTKDGDAKDHSTLEKIGLGAAAVPLAAAVLHNDKEADAAKQPDADKSTEQSRPSRLFASLRRKSHKSSPSESSKAEREAPPIPALPAAAKKEDVALPSFSGAPAGGAIAKPAVSSAAPASNPSASGMTKPPNVSSQEEKPKTEHRGGFLGLFKSKHGDADKAATSSAPAVKPAPAPTKAPAPPSKEPGFVKVGHGTKGVANESASGAPQDKSSWPAPAAKARKSMESSRTAASKRSKRGGANIATATPTSSGSAAGPSTPMTTVEEIVEQTKDGPRKYLVHHNPARGAGKAPAAVQWRNPFNF